MDFEFDDDQELLRATVRRFLAEQAPLPWVRTMLEDPRGTTDAVWKGLCDLDVVGLLATAKHGGAGMGMVDAAVVLEEMGRAAHPGPYLSSAIGAVTLVDDPDLLRTLAAGTSVGTVLGLTDDASVSPVFSARASDADSDRWTLTGTEHHALDAVAADVLVVVAGELAVFVVDADAAGVSVTPTPTVDGTRKEATVAFTNTPARLLAAANEHTLAAIRTTRARLLLGAVLEGLGAAEAALELAVAYAKERHQFGKPIGSFQAVQHLCADMLRTVELGRAVAYYAAWTCDAASPEEQHRAITMALAFAADGFYSVAATSIQVFGGIGFTWEHDAHLFYKRLLSLQVLAGGAGAQLEELATIALDQPARAT